MDDHAAAGEPALGSVRSGEQRRLQTMSALSAQSRAVLAGRSFFPHLISAPFQSGLREAFAFAVAACLVAASASLLRGGRYYADESSTFSGDAPSERQPTPARASAF